jgi:hypothetical protein
MIEFNDDWEDEDVELDEEINFNEAEVIEDSAVSLRLRVQNNLFNWYCYKNQ